MYRKERRSAQVVAGMASWSLSQINKWNFRGVRWNKRLVIKMLQRKLIAGQNLPRFCSPGLAIGGRFIYCFKRFSPKKASVNSLQTQESAKERTPG